MEQTQPMCQNVFRNGGQGPSAEEFTQKWVELINALLAREEGPCGGGE